MTPDQRRKLAQNLRQPQTGSLPSTDDSQRYPAVSPGLGKPLAAAANSSSDCIRNVIESHEVYLEAIQEDLANYQGILRVLLQRLANSPNDPAILSAIASVERQIASREEDEELQSARLSGASDCSGC